MAGHMPDGMLSAEYSVTLLSAFAAKGGTVVPSEARSELYSSLHGALLSIRAVASVHTKLEAARQATDYSAEVWPGDGAYGVHMHSVSQQSCSAEWRAAQHSAFFPARALDPASSLHPIAFHDGSPCHHAPGSRAAAGPRPGARARQQPPRRPRRRRYWGQRDSRRSLAFPASCGCNCVVALPPCPSSWTARG